MVHDGEIVGLHASSNGREFAQHPICGIHVAVGNIVHFKRDVLDIEGHPETVIKAVLVKDGSETGTVGFLPRHVAMRLAEVTRLHGKFVMFIELYALCDESTMKRIKSERNQEMASFHLLDDIQEWV